MAKVLQIFKVKEINVKYRRYRLNESHKFNHFDTLLLMLLKLRDEAV